MSGGFATPAFAGQLIVNDGVDGGCAQHVEGAPVQITDALCNVSSIGGLSSSPVGTLVLNGYGGFLKGNLTIDGVFDLNSHKITSLSAGTASTDAVNVGQLSPLVNSLGGGAKIDPTTGAVTGPTYNLTNGGTQTTVGGALTALDNALTTANTNISTNATNISSLQTKVDNGSVGLVKQDATTQAITVASATGGTSINFAGTAGGRVLSGVANGVADSDAVTIAQLKAAGLISPTGKPLLSLVYDDLTMGSAMLGGTKGTVLRNLANGSIAHGSMEAINGGQLFDFQQDVQNQLNALNNQVNQITQGLNDGSLGGAGGAGTGTNSAALGEGANASGSGSTASGANSVASGNNSTANGSGAQATGNNSTALGSNATASANNSVALGGGSVADRDNTVSVGSVGAERQITNVAAGTERTDAANWGQVQDAVQGAKDWASRKFEQVDGRIDRMGAMSAAYSQMAFSAQGVNTPNRVGVGVGMQGGKSAVAVGVSHQFSPNFNVSFGGSASGKEASVGAGMAFGW
nr:MULTISPECIES: YadA-like family protein [Dyella]